VSNTTKALLTVPLRDFLNGGNRADYNKVGANSTMNRRLPTNHKAANTREQVYQITRTPRVSKWNP
jgi:hypothetical protein